MALILLHTSITSFNCIFQKLFSTLVFESLSLTYYYYYITLYTFLYIKHYHQRMSNILWTECSDEHSCQGLGEHAHFGNFGMAFLTLFRVATGDNWNGIMKDALREDCDNAADCVKNCCVADGIAPMFFVIFVLMAQFVLVNVVVAVLMKHLEESHKQVRPCISLKKLSYSLLFIVQ